MNNLFGFKCIIGTKVGEINKKKMELLSDKLKEELPFKAVSLDNTSVMLRNDLHSTSLIINPQQVVYIIENGNVTIEQINYLQQLLKIVTDILLLEDTVNVTFDFISHIETSDNSMTESKKMINFGKKDQYLGSGIRLFFNYNSILSEIKVEPLLTNNSRYYVESLVNCQNISYENITQDGITAYNDYKQRVDELKEFIIH